MLVNEQETRDLAGTEHLVLRIVLVAAGLAVVGAIGVALFAANSLDFSGESDSPAYKNMATCSSWDGKVVSSKEWRFGCKLTDDRFPLAGSIPCADGRRLWHNAWGWGYEGEVAHRHTRADGQLFPPASETKACNGT